MKKLLCATVAVIMLGACAKTSESIKTGPAGDEQMSYAFGMIMASDFEGLDMEFNYEAFAKGFQEQIEGKATISFEEAVSVAQAAYSAAVSVISERTKQEGLAFLEENSTKTGISLTESGLQYEVISEGDGERALASDTVQVHYEGTLIDGTVFDSSYRRGEPAEFQLNKVIPGWTEGIQLMNKGSTYRFFIPSELAYGERGAGQSVPPNSVLIFKVELLDITVPQE